VSDELDRYRDTLQRQASRVARVVDGRTDAELNWRPPVPDANSAYVIASHILGMTEAWVLGIACGVAMGRDRPAEFTATGSAEQLASDARNLAAHIGEALSVLPAGELNVVREPGQELWGEGTAHPLTVRETLQSVIAHSAEHLGQLDLTLDLARAAVAT
jgi:hypothetical protein